MDKQDFKLSDLLLEGNRCRRCGEKVEKKSDLRCSECRMLVNQEFNKETQRPFRFYFERWQKQSNKH